MMESLGLLLLVFTTFTAEGAKCPVSSPQCYKKNTLPDEDLYCEWKDQDHSQNATYILFIHSWSANAPHSAFNAQQALTVRVPLESIFITSQSDIWVQRTAEKKTCNSTITSVILNETVKYSAPDIQKKLRSAGVLTLHWSREADNKGAEYEIRWRTLNASWENATFETKDSKTVKWDTFTLQLQNYSVYQVQVRRRAKKYLLWSEWSHTVYVPVEIQAPVVHWKEERTKEKRKIRLTWDPPPPEASYGGVFYNLTLNLACESKNKTTRTTSYKLTVTDSEVRVSVTAFNSVSKSAPQHVIIPPVRHLQHCPKDSETSKRYACLEWYKLIDGETRPMHVNVSRKATINDIKKNMDEFVRYYYFIQAGRNQHRHTKHMCPIYSTEGAPGAQPQNVSVVNVTHESAVLSWRPIAVQDQHGFLLHYTVWISREASDTVYHEVPENQTSFLLRHLSTGSFYTVHIAGQTKAGVGPNSTLNFLTNSAPLPAPYNGLLKIILSVCAAVLVLSLGLSFAVKRLRRKLLPTIPNPVIPPTAFNHLNLQNMRAVTEDVHDVVVLLHNPDKPSNCLNLEETTQLQDCQLSEEEEEEEDDEEDEAHCTTSFPNPNYKGQMLRLPEEETADKSQKENNCEVITSVYRPGSVL